jgi:predicted aldo/keto reductase-like oxidoreductase
MVYRQFGKTGKTVSAIGMGLTRFPPEKFNSEEGRECCAELIVKAWERGINYFDTAPTYCDGKSEIILGLALKRIRGKVYISDKSSSTVDSTEKQLRGRLEQSLTNLGVDRIAFYNMWGILDYDQYLDVIKPGGPYEGAVAAKRDGLIEHICFSAHCTGEELERILEDDRFEGLTIGYNAINFKFREKGLIAAYEKGLGVATMNPLNGGVIPSNPELFSYISAGEGMNLAQSALLFNASHPAVSVVLSGMSQETELEENTAAFQKKHYYSKEKISGIKDRIESAYDFLCTGCRYCEGCPQNIPINRLMLSYNQFVLSGDYNDFLGQMFEVWRYYPEQRFDCVDCGACEKKCTQHLKIAERIALINERAAGYAQRIAPQLKSHFDVPADAKLAIYASGPYAARVMGLLDRKNFKNEMAVFDSNPDKWGKESAIDGYIVNPPEKFRETSFDKILVASHAHYREIKDMLQKDYAVEAPIVELYVEFG